MKKKNCSGIRPIQGIFEISKYRMKTHLSGYFNANFVEHFIDNACGFFFVSRVFQHIVQRFINCKRKFKGLVFLRHQSVHSAHILISSVISIFILACAKLRISPAIFSGRIILFISPIVCDVVANAPLNATFAPIFLFWKPTLVILLFAVNVRFFCFRTAINCFANNLHASVLPSLALFLISASYLWSTKTMKCIKITNS